MRASINIVEREPMLDVLEEWCGDMFNDEFESNKGYLETELLRYSTQMQPYQSVSGNLYRGTGGLSKADIRNLRKGQSVELDLSESGMTSWSKDFETALEFAEKHKGVVIGLPSSALNVFLDIEAFWYDMSEAEQRTWRAIGIAKNEREVIARTPASLTLTADLIAWPDLSAQPKAKAPLLTKMTADERRDLLIQRAAVAHPDRTAEEIAKRTYALSDQKVFELLKTSYTG